MIIGTSLEYSFARGAEACTNDRATICSFKTKNIDRARKRREGLEERREVRGKKKIKIERIKIWANVLRILLELLRQSLFLLKKQARRRSTSDVLALLYVLRTLPSCSESDQAPCFKPKFNWRRNERRQKVKLSWEKTWRMTKGRRSGSLRQNQHDRD